MKFFYPVLFFLTIFNFSGVPEILPEILEDKFVLCFCSDDECGTEEKSSKEKEDKTEKETEEEDAQESLLYYHYAIATQDDCLDISSRYRMLNETGYVPEDHSPPPEFA